MDDDTFDDCPECGGPALSMGIWAGRFYLRCRNCGIHYYHSRPVSERGERGER
jgi:tRNA(Ile2) C34 agmatinyltransferase TiaS